MRWVLLLVLLGLLLGRRALLGDLMAALRAGPKQFRDARRLGSDPVARARDVTGPHRPDP